MCTLRVVILFIGLALCVCARARNGTSKNVGASESAWSNPGSVKDHRSRFVLMLEMVQDAETGDGELAQDTADLESKHQHQTKSGDQILEIFPRDLRRKEKFLKHLTGPLYFSSKCRKDVYRLYHNTRDCTIPAYYKRCARLLTRLAGNPRCLES